MLSFQKKIQRTFVYFFTGVSVLIVVLGIQRVKQGGALGTTASPETAGGTSDATGAITADSKVAGTSQTISANGKTYQTPWGDLATTIKVKDGKIIAVEIPQLPDSPPSLQAKAYLIDQVLRSGSANIQGVSGVTITSRAFKASLESALASAKAQGSEVVPTQNTSNTVAVEVPSVDVSVQDITIPVASKPASTQPANTVGAGVSGTFTGNAYQTPWGNAVASVTFTNGKITGVAMPQVPNSPPSVQAKPYLIDQALAMGSSNIQGVSGATYASIAFKSSLESAIAKAGSQGTISTPTPSSNATSPTQTAKPSIPRKYHDDEGEKERDNNHNEDEWDD